jgi:hypothetical protein
MHVLRKLSFCICTRENFSPPEAAGQADIGLITGQWMMHMEMGGAP